MQKHKMDIAARGYGKYEEMPVNKFWKWFFKFQVTKYWFNFIFQRIKKQKVITKFNVLSFDFVEQKA